MTFGKASALAAGFLGAMAIGIWIGPHVTNRAASVAETPGASVAEAPASAPTSQPAAPGPRSTSRNAATRNADAARKPAATIPPSDEDVQAHVKSLLNKGSDMTIASQGFRDAEQFASVAHAARNTEIPFVLLKHRVLSEGKTLAVAIRESKPDLNAAVEADRARAEAKSDLAKLRG